MYDPVSHLVHAVGRDKVSDVWIGGARVVDAHRVTSVDEAIIMTRARAWQQRLQ